MPRDLPSIAKQEAQARPQTFFIHKIYKVFQNHFRPKRKRAFIQLFPDLEKGLPVLDVGGTASWWKEDFPGSVNISIVNVDDSHQREVSESGFKFFKADGRALPFEDKQFYLTFSNSVIEHVGDLKDQMQFAAEARRCGEKLYLQTPNKWFPVEPHLITVFIHWLPFRVARRLLRYCSIWGMVTRPSQKQIDEFLSATRLLSRREIKAIFPGAQIKEEKFLGLTKSFIVVVSA